MGMVATGGKGQRQGARPDIDGRRLAHRRHQNLDAIVLGGFGQGGIARQAGDRPRFAAITDADIRRVQAVADTLHRLVEQQIDAGLTIATSLRAGETAGASLPNGATLAMKGVEGKTPDPLPAIKYYDEQMAKSVLAHVLNLGGDQSTGSYALGDTFASIFTQSLQGISDQVDDVINAHVIEDLVDVNWGPDEPAPRLVSDRIGTALTAEALKALVDAGVITPDEKLENFTRDRYGLPVHDLATTRQPQPATPTNPEESPDAA